MPTPSGSQPKLTGRLLLWAITSALAGFLFGFDTVVISGAEQTIQALWGLSVGMVWQRHLHGRCPALYLGKRAVGASWAAGRDVPVQHRLRPVIAFLSNACWPASVKARGAGCWASPQTSARGFWSMRLRAPIMLAFLVAFVDQHSGINAILYYTPRILEMTGTTACGTAALRQADTNDCGDPIRTT